MTDFRTKPQDRYLDWALLVESSPTDLRGAVADARREYCLDEDAVFDGSWEIVAGNGAWSAFVDYAGPGGDVFERLARHVTQELRRDAFALLFGEHDYGVVPIEAGEFRKPLAEQRLYDFASARGIYLGEHAPTFTVRAAFLAEETTPAEVETAIDTAGLLLRPTKRGTVVTGSIGSQTFDLVEELPERTIYELRHHVDRGTFKATIFRGFDDVSVYMHPKNWAPTDDKVIDSVLGETEPAAIARKLDIPLADLSLRKHGFET